jgi:hypothetical protein
VITTVKQTLCVAARWAGVLLLAALLAAALIGGLVAFVAMTAGMAEMAGAA